MRAILSMVMMWVMLGATGAAAQLAAPPSAQPAAPRQTEGDQALPPFDLLVFLDRSKTIFTGAGSGAPNERVAEMLRTVFERKIDGGRRTFVTAGDRVNLYTFGSDVRVIAERVDGGNPEALNASLGRFGDVVGDDLTDFSRLLTSITENPVLTARDNRLKLVMIASDFVDDPFNNARRPKDKLGVCDLLDQHKVGHKTRLDPQIKSLSEVLERTVADGSARPYVGLLIVEPKKEDYPGLRAFTDNPDNYLNCVLQTVAAAPIPTTLEERIDAGRIRYDEVANDADAFADRFVTAVFRATLPRLLIESGECRQRRQSIECTLTLRNNARVSNTVSRVRFFPDDKAQVPFDVRSGITLAPGQVSTVTLPIPALDAARLGTSRIMVTVEDEGVGTSARKEIPLNIPSPPIIRSADSARHLAAEPLKVTVAVENPNREPIIPKVLRFFETETSGGSLGEAVLDGAASVEPAGVVSLPAAAPLPAQQRLLRGEPVFAAVAFTLADGETPLESKRLRVGAPNLTPLVVSKARVDSVEGSQTEFNLSLEVQNASGPAKRVTEILLFSKPDGGKPVDTIGVPSGPEIGSLPVALQVRLPGKVSQLVTGSLYVAVVDSQTGFPSAPVAATAPPTLAPLRLVKAEIRQVAEDGRFELEAVVDNPSGANSGVIEITLHAGQNGPMFKRLPVAASKRTIIGLGSQTVTFPLTEESDRDIIETWGLEAGCVDALGKDCSNHVPVASALRATPLQIRTVSWAEPRDGMPTLDLELFNPGGVSVTLEKLFVERSGASSIRVQLPLPNPVDVRYQKAVKVQVVYREELWEQFHPRNKVMLVPECRQIDCTGVKREVPAPPETALIMSKDAPVWSTEGTSPTVTITVRNPLGFPHPVKSVWGAADATGRQAMLVTNYAGDTLQTVPERQGELKLPIVFGADAMGLLGGDQVFLCVLGIYDAAPPPDAFKCHQAWLGVKIDKRGDVRPVINPDNAFERQARKLNLRATVEGALPQQVYAVAVDPADGGKPLLIPLPEPKVVTRGQPVTISIPLTPEQVARLEAAGVAKVAFVDKNNRGAPPDSRLGSSDVMLETNRYEIKLAEARRHEVYGSGGRTNVKAHVAVARQSLGYGDRQKLTLWLADTNDGELPGTRKEVELTFNGQDAQVTPVWIIRPEDKAIAGRISRVHALIEGRLPSQAAAVVEIDTWRARMNGACTYLFIAGAAALGAGVLLHSRWLRRKVPFIQKLRLPGGSLNTMLTNTANFMTIFSGLSIMPIVGRWLTEILGLTTLHDWITGNIAILILENFFISALISIGLCLATSVWVNRSVAKILDEGSACIEYQQLISQKHRLVLGVAYASAFSFVALSLVLWLLLVGPYEQQANIQPICVGLSCQQG